MNQSKISPNLDR